jgi:hypothetical protein
MSAGVIGSGDKLVPPKPVSALSGVAALRRN